MSIEIIFKGYGINKMQKFIFQIRILMLPTLLSYFTFFEPPLPSDTF